MSLMEAQLFTRHLPDIDFSSQLSVLDKTSDDGLVKGNDLRLALDCPGYQEGPDVG